MREYYTITELTREFEVSTRTLRFYEDEGLIQPLAPWQNTPVPSGRPASIEADIAWQTTRFLDR